MDWKSVTSKENPTYRGLVKLSRSRRERKRRGVTLLDGARLVDAYLRKGGEPELVVVREGASAEKRVRGIVERCRRRTPLLLAAGLFAAISTVKTPGGILAVVSIPAERAAGGAGDILLLEDIQDPGNMGMMLRSAAAAGIAGAYLSRRCCDLWSPKVLRAGMGAHFSLSLHDGSDLVETARAFPGKVVALDPAGERSIFEVNLASPVALAIGNEGAGLSALLGSVADERVRIPMPGWEESLNAGAAATVGLFEMVRQREKTGQNIVDRRMRKGKLS
jgi:TrmH family RNA methyltransferase